MDIYMEISLYFPYTQTFLYLKKKHHSHRGFPSFRGTLRQETQTSAQIFEAAGQRFLKWLGGIDVVTDQPTLGV